SWFGASASARRHVDDPPNSGGRHGPVFHRPRSGAGLVGLSESVPCQVWAQLAGGDFVPQFTELARTPRPARLITEDGFDHAPAVVVHLVVPDALEPCISSGETFSLVDRAAAGEHGA